jgi:hypothetical protein
LATGKADPLRTKSPSPGLWCKERRRRVSKACPELVEGNVPERTTGAAFWTILRDARVRGLLRMRPADEPGIPMAPPWQLLSHGIASETADADGRREPGSPVISEKQ